MTKKIYLKVNTDINAEDEILSWFEQVNQPPFADNTIWWQLQTLLVEGFINIVEHAHKNLSVETPIELEALRFSEHIEIRIWSYGPAFDLTQQLQQTLELEDNYQERGRGLKIMSKLVDKLSYEPTGDNRYCLFISKKY
ncbi:MAG: anti-sigma regulatory factor [Gloeotrichia echinulata IR180]|jgi:serine/threonine-protein kinase RsbW|nr:anti-sigma regulatory factor [Gloeotrichia echinulata DEX184]